MNPHLFSTVAAIFWIPLVTANAQIAGTYEPFTHQANAKSWFVYDFADGESYIPQWDSAGDGLNPDIYFTFTGTNPLDFTADQFASGGAFVGDLAAAGVDAISCDVLVEISIRSMSERSFCSPRPTTATTSANISHPNQRVGLRLRLAYRGKLVRSGKWCFRSGRAHPGDPE